ncbi:hypothetical protein [Phormidium sp. CCY1219]|uniref:hypothetical protein n=1 Tax=Phormidium sp. CCY1219 TaxID=2886104 RepID=UPI002D1F9047|nr:hypothetical protein [Phormidium sp. CCY1219]MEB3826491.1 hypothetical protein [Phormidium sp. CCY1219]
MDADRTCGWKARRSRMEEKNPWRSHSSGKEEKHGDEGGFGTAPTSAPGVKRSKTAIFGS